MDATSPLFRTRLKNNEEKRRFLANELRSIFGSFDEFRTKMPDLPNGVVLTTLHDYSILDYNNENTKTAKARSGGRVEDQKRDIDRIIREMTTLPPLIEKINYVPNGKNRKSVTSQNATKMQNGVNNTRMSVDGIVDVMSVAARPLSPLATARSASNVCEERPVKVEPVEHEPVCDAFHKETEFSDGELAENGSISPLNLPSRDHHAKLVNTEPISTDFHLKHEKSDHNVRLERVESKSPTKKQKSSRKSPEKRRRDSDSHNQDVSRERGKSAESRRSDLKARNGNNNDSSRSSHQYKSKRKEDTKRESSRRGEDRFTNKSRSKSPDPKRPRSSSSRRADSVELPMDKDGLPSNRGSLRPCDRSLASTPEIRPSSRSTHNKVFRPIKPPSFAVGEYEGYDYPCSSRSVDHPDQCVFLNRRKLPAQSFILSTVRQFVHGIPTKLSDQISTGCMTRSLYAAGLMLCTFSSNSVKKEAELKQALAVIRTISTRLFDDRSGLPRNKHIVKGMLSLCEGLVCSRLYHEHYQMAKKRRSFVKQNEEILNRTRSTDDNETLEVDALLEACHSEPEGRELLKELASDTVCVPRLFYKSLLEDQRLSSLAENTVMAQFVARHELEVEESNFLKRLREMRFDLDGSATSLADAIFTVAFWMQRSSRFNVMPTSAPSHNSDSCRNAV